MGNGLPSLSYASIIVRNFKMRNGSPSSPGRLCAKRTGLPSFRFTSSATTACAPERGLQAPGQPLPSPVHAYRDVDTGRVHRARSRQSPYLRGYARGGFRRRRARLANFSELTNISLVAVYVGTERRDLAGPTGANGTSEGRSVIRQRVCALGEPGLEWCHDRVRLCLLGSSAGTLEVDRK